MDNLDVMHVSMLQYAELRAQFDAVSVQIQAGV